MEKENEKRKKKGNGRKKCKKEMKKENEKRKCKKKVEVVRIKGRRMGRKGSVR